MSPPTNIIESSNVCLYEKKRKRRVFYSYVASSGKSINRSSEKLTYRSDEDIRPDER
jgi:hypothetical protein